MRKLLLFLCAAFIMWSPVMEAQNKSMKNIKQQKQKTQKEIKETTRKIKQNTTQTKRSLNQLNLITAEIKEQDKTITYLTIQLDSIEKIVVVLNDSIDKQEKRLDKLKKNYSNAIKKMQSHSSSFDDLIFIFSADSFRQAYRRMRYLQQFSRWREKQASDIKEAQSKLVAQRQQLKSLSNAKAGALASVNSAQKKLEAQKIQQAGVVNTLKKEGSQLKILLSEKEKKSRALDRELDRLIAEEERKAAERARIAEEKRLAEERRQAEERRIAEEKRKIEEERLAQQEKKDDNKKQTKEKTKKTVESKHVKTEEPAKTGPSSPIRQGEYHMNEAERSLSGSFESNKGRLPFPVSGKYRIVKQFGRHRHPELQYIQTDNGGIDIETEPGTSAKAVFDGVVSAVFPQDGFNTVVMVRHGNYLTIYVNLSDIYIRSGQSIKANQPIGKIFSDPEDDNRTILHFEIRKEKVKLNPEDWLR